MGGAGFETNFFVRHDPCPSCGSRNNLGRYSDGHGHCYGCGYREAGNGRVLEKTSNGAPIRQAKLEMNGTYEAIPERRISVDTCRKALKILHSQILVLSSSKKDKYKTKLNM